MAWPISFPQAGLWEGEPCSERIGNHVHEHQMIPAVGLDDHRDLEPCSATGVNQ